jgi:hypothetical protein
MDQPARWPYCAVIRFATSCPYHTRLPGRLGAVDDAQPAAVGLAAGGPAGPATSALAQHIIDGLKPAV